MSLADIFLEAERRGCTDLVFKAIAEVGTERLPTTLEAYRAVEIPLKGKRETQKPETTFSTDAAAGYGCATKASET